MTAIAVAEQTVAAPLSAAFAHFIDFAHWDLWMPKIFFPVAGPARPLQTGDQFKVGIGKLKLPVDAKVIRLRAEKEICWRAGPALLLQGEHSFMFSDVGGQTLVRSEEPLVGLLTIGPLGSLVERGFADGSRAILAGFAAYIARTKA